MRAYLDVGRVGPEPDCWHGKVDHVGVVGLAVVAEADDLAAPDLGEVGDLRRRGVAPSADDLQRAHQRHGTTCKRTSGQVGAFEVKGI